MRGAGSRSGTSYRTMVSGIVLNPGALEPDVRGLRPLAIARGVQGAAGEQVDESGDRQTDEHREIRFVERARHGPGVELRAEEGNHSDEADAIREESTPVPPPVHAVRVENLTD